MNHNSLVQNCLVRVRSWIATFFSSASVVDLTPRTSVSTQSTSRRTNAARFQSMLASKLTSLSKSLANSTDKVFTQQTNDEIDVVVFTRSVTSSQDRCSHTKRRTRASSAWRASVEGLLTSTTCAYRPSSTRTRKLRGSVDPRKCARKRLSFQFLSLQNS